MKTLYLVACVAGKRDGMHPAKDLYTSQWFKKARAAVEATGSPWAILSSLYGLTSPNSTIATYEKTLNSMKKAERHAWANEVFKELHRMVKTTGIERVVFLAGVKYRQDLIPKLRDEFPNLTISVPMQGMPIGEQLSWLNHNALP